jgi:hypothetical protein
VREADGGETEQAGDDRAHVSGPPEDEGDAVHAVAQAGRLRPVVEHVPQVAAAPAAMHLGPGHAAAITSPI